MRIFLIIICTLFCISCTNHKGKLLPTELRCEYLEGPMGIDTGEPRFSWILESESMDVIQTTYEIMVSKEDDGFNHKSIVWSSGRIISGESVNIPYQGMPLQSQSNYFWKVRIWDKQSGESRWSRVSAFHTGFLGPDTFHGKWINAPDSSLRSPLMRKIFPVQKEVNSAHVYAAAIGLYELYINGSKVDDRLFEPATSQFTERLLYSVYDVTNLLTPGENVIGIWMGEGQAAFRPAPDGRFSNINMNVSPFSRPMMLLDLRVIYDDGSEEIIGTDESWKCASSPITFNNYFGGEDYDARLELPGWSSNEFDEGNWMNVSEGEYHGKLSARLIPDVTEGKTYEPVTILQRDSHTWDYDFGTTIGGYWEITVEGKAGAEVIVRGTEKCGSSSHQKPLTEENQLNWENNHTGKFFYRDCYSKYILKGEGAEVYKPRFFYQGHRYLQVKISNPEDVKVLKVRNIEVGNALSQSGSFECSDEYLNILHRIVVQTFKNNFIQGVPLSNPNSEKYGWTGDVHLFAEAAGYSFDLPAFWTKWMQDFPDAQKWAGMDGLIPVTVPELRKRSSLVSDVSWLAVYPFILMQMNRNYMDVR
ncbi:MAG: family 78 glycoside hydrolase catalytic domain, partial [Bacteroidales bacterium]|nr:family 78 glycoside hydrolase catalytic domain [Bacteroidales bacterium]